MTEIGAPVEEATEATGPEHPATDDPPGSSRASRADPPRSRRTRRAVRGDSADPPRSRRADRADPPRSRRTSRADPSRSPGPVGNAAAVAGAAVAATSSGEIVLLGVLLGVAAADVATAVVAVAAVVAFAMRWGSTSLDAIAGAQAVLGAAGTVGPWAALAATWCAATALVVVAPAGWAAVAFGTAAALGVAGPAPGGVADVALRVGATAVGVALAVLAGRFLPRRQAQIAGLLLGTAALALAVAG